MGIKENLGVRGMAFERCEGLEGRDSLFKNGISE